MNEIKVGKIEFAPQATDVEIFEAMLEMEDKKMPPISKTKVVIVKKEKYDRLTAEVNHLNEFLDLEKLTREGLYKERKQLTAENAELKRQRDEAVEMLIFLYRTPDDHPALGVVSNFVNTLRKEKDDKWERDIAERIVKKFKDEDENLFLDDDPEVPDE